MVERDDVAIAGGRHVDVTDAEHVFERGLSRRGLAQADDLMISMMLTLEKTFRSFGKNSFSASDGEKVAKPDEVNRRFVQRKLPQTNQRVVRIKSNARTKESPQ